MRSIALPITLLIGSVLLAQTGPGGVGNSTNNALWLSAENGIAAAGTEVVTWNDRSGNGNNATSPSAAARPTLAASALNGYPIITFDGVDDEMRIMDAGSLDMNEWDIFFVSAENTAKNNNAWLAKGTNTQPNYALWSTSTGALQLPIYDIFGLFSNPATPAGTTTSAFSLLHYNNTVVFFLFPSRNVFKAGVSIYSDASLLQLPVQNGNQLYIGNVQGSAGWNLDGDLAEVIIYRQPINSTQRLIINNYLSAKYTLPLTANNIYVHDNPANGDYDHEVAGIGRLSGANAQTDSQGSAVVRINNASGLGNNEFLIWGHDNNILGSWGSTDFPPGLQGRWHRVWRVNEVSSTGVAVDVGNVDMTFDLTAQGTVTASDLRLLVDINNNGIFADDTPVPIAATFLGGNLYRFAGVSQLVNNRRFTLGTINVSQTPLPVELLYFDAEAQYRIVNVTWSTASELNSDHFTVERSADGSTWEKVAELPGAGTSNTPINYSVEDPLPIPGLSYYRLKQVDKDGACIHSEMKTVRLEFLDDILVYPNPGQDIINVIFETSGTHQVQLMDDLGRMINVPVILLDGRAQLDVSTVPPGCYLLAAITEKVVVTKRLVVSR